jgi:hypothetical protein
MSSGTRVSSVEVRHKVRSMNIIPRLPRVVFHSITFPLDKVPQLPVDHLAIQDLLDSPFLLSINKFRRRRWSRTMTRDRIWVS